MRRREFISLVGGATIAWSLVARAQQPPVVGYLGLTSVRTDAYYMGSFRKALRGGF
jgi:putative tryptophan/tyrosine transport system substrate-binding protein